MKTFEELTQFIDYEMSMSHVYQPVVIRALLEDDGVATLRRLAGALLAHDEPELIATEETLKAMPLRVLAARGIVVYDRDTRTARLNSRRLTFEQRLDLGSRCERRLAEYAEKRGQGIWSYRDVDEGAVPQSKRYAVLAASDRRCALCRATGDDSELQVDHIIPRSRGGSSEVSNLQVLCARCNGGKSNRDSRDFRPPVESEHSESCIFCHQADASPEDGLSVFAVEDGFPVAEGHMLVIPRRHTQDFFSLTEVERIDVDQLLRVLRNDKATADSAIEGFNVGWNCGEVAGQTVMHAHAHLIPRRKGDVPQPAGGVRAVIPGRQDPGASPPVGAP